MPIVFQGIEVPTAQDILDCSAQDIRQVLSATDPAHGQNILLDYVNRISLDLLRFSRWTFLLAPVFKFVTQQGVTDYWFGPSPPPVDQVSGGIVDTQLEILDAAQIKRDSVFDRSNSVRLGRTDNAPLGQVFELNAHPKLFRVDPTTPAVLNVYPPPDYGTAWPIATISRTANILTITSASTMDFQVNEGNNLVWVQGAVDPSFNGYWPILSVPNGQTVIAQNFGPNASTTAATASSGYTIEFRYFRLQQQVNEPTQPLQIPIIYKDILCAGVDWLGFKYLQKDEDSQHWFSVYTQGRIQMVKDKNLFPRAEEFVRPDPLAIIQQTTTGVGLDSGLETSIP